MRPDATDLVARVAGGLARQQDPDEARRRAEEILARPEFQPPGRSPVERVLDWVFDRLDELFGRLGGIGGGGSAGLIGWLLLAAGAATLVALVVTAVRRRPRRSPRDVKRAAVVVDRSREPRDWRDEAAGHAAAGRWKDALRCRYRALVGDLARRGLLDEIPGRTTGEERSQLAVTTPPAAPDFSRATDLFDRAWYGDEPTGPAEHERFVALETTVLTTVDAGVAAGAATSRSGVAGERRSGRDGLARPDDEVDR
jgi:hypothetical protein